MFISLLKDNLGMGDGFSSSSSPLSNFSRLPFLDFSSNFGVSFGLDARSMSIASCRFSARKSLSTEVKRRQFYLHK